VFTKKTFMLVTKGRALLQIDKKGRASENTVYTMNIQNDVIGLVLCQNCKSKQVTGFIA
jgi:hypothetical protein